MFHLGSLGLRLLMIFGYCKAKGLSLEEFLGYPFGTEFGYGSIQQLDTSRGAAIPSPHHFKYFGNTYNFVSIVTHGHIFFLNGSSSVFSRFVPTSFPFTHTTWGAMIAPFWTDINSGAGGIIWHRSVFNENASDLNIINNINQYVKANSIISDFNCAWALIVTWDHVVPTSSSSQALNNTFQVVIATDWIISLAIFIYADNGIHWSLSAGHHAECGYNVGDGVNFFTLPGSSNESIVNIDSVVGNTGKVGQWIFLLDSCTTFRISVENVTSTSAILTWNVSASLNIALTVYRSTVITNASIFKRVTVQEPPVELMGLDPNTTYVVRMNAVTNSTEFCFETETISFTTDAYDVQFLSTFNVRLEQCKTDLLCSCMEGIFSSLEELSYGKRTGPLGLIVQEQPGISIKRLLPVLLNSTSTLELPVDAKIHTIYYDCFNDVLTLATYQSEADYSLFPNIHIVIQPVMRLNILLNSRLLSRLELRGMMTLHGDLLNVEIDATNSSLHSFTAIKSNSTSDMSTELISLLDNGFGIAIPSTPLSSQLDISNLSLKGNVERGLPGMYQLSAALNGDIHIGDWHNSDVTVVILISEGRENTASVFIITGFHSLQSISLLAFLRNAYGSDISSTTFFNNMILTDYFISYASENFTISQTMLTKLQLPPSLPFEASAFRGFSILFNFNTSRSGHTSNFTRWIFNYERSIIAFNPLALVTDGVSVGDMLLLISGNDSIISSHHILLETVQSHSVKMMHLDTQMNTVSIHVDIMGVEVRQQAQAIVFKDIELAIPLHLDATPNLQTFSISNGLENFLS